MEKADFTPTRVIGECARLEIDEPRSLWRVIDKKGRTGRVFSLSQVDHCVVTVEEVLEERMRAAKDGKVGRFNPPMYLRSYDYSLCVVIKGCDKCTCTDIALNAEPVGGRYGEEYEAMKKLAREMESALKG